MKIPGLRDKIQGAMKEALKKSKGEKGKVMGKKNNSIGLRKSLFGDIKGQQDRTGQTPFGKKVLS